MIGGRVLTYVIALTIVSRTLAIAEMMALIPRPIAETTDPCIHISFKYYTDKDPGAYHYELVLLVS